ncbi:MAG: hypothetical protein ABF649_13295 [Bacillus sp. (in: firmicutes)]
MSFITIDYAKEYIKKELSKYKKITIPRLKMSLEGDELAEWIMEEASPEDIVTMVVMIEEVKNRSSSPKTIFQTVAIGLFYS